MTQNTPVEPSSQMLAPNAKVIGTYKFGSNLAGLVVRRLGRPEIYYVDTRGPNAFVVPVRNDGKLSHKALWPALEKNEQVEILAKKELGLSEKLEWFVPPTNPA